MKSKILVLTIVLSLLISGMLVAVGGEAMVEKESFGENMGMNEIQSAQKINDWDDLNDMRDNLGGDYILKGDLDEDTAGYDEVVNTESGWDPIGERSVDEDIEFSGTFDGNGYEIRDLYVNRPETSSVGLFGAVDDGEVTDVGIVDVDVNGKKWVGGLVGMTWLGTTVSNSYVTGNVSGDTQVGGLLGSSTGPVKDSYATATVSGTSFIGGLVGEAEFPVSNSYATGGVSGENEVGGLVGSNAGDTISNSYATGDVSGDTRVGGLVGTNWMGTVEKSYAAGAVSGNDLVGGLVGENEDDQSTVSSSYWDEESTGQTDGFGKNNGEFDAEGLSTSEMQGDSAEENLDGLDFGNTWKTIEGDYPSLRLEEDGQNGDGGTSSEDGIPGFTSILLLVAAIMAVAIYKKKR